MEHETMTICEGQWTYADMRRAEHTHRCAVCKAGLTTCWGGTFGINGYVLRCSRDARHTGMERIPTKEREMSMTDSTALQTMGEKRMLERVNQARFTKDLTPVECKLVAQVASEYGLDPLMNELMVYQGRLFVTLDARRRKAQETGNLDGISTRPATPEEYEARRIPLEDYLHCAEVYVKGAAHPFVGWGRVRAGETKGNAHLPIVNDPQFMAEKRAEAHALRRAFHLPLPSAEDMFEGEYTVVPDGDGDGLKEVKERIWEREDATDAIRQQREAQERAAGEIDMDWLRKSCEKTRWAKDDMLRWLYSQYRVKPEGSVTQTLARLTAEQRRLFVKEVERRLAAVPAF